MFNIYLFTEFVVVYLCLLGCVVFVGSLLLCLSWSCRSGPVPVRSGPVRSGPVRSRPGRGLPGLAWPVGHSVTNLFGTFTYLVGLASLVGVVRFGGLPVGPGVVNIPCFFLYFHALVTLELNIIPFGNLTLGSFVHWRDIRRFDH